MPTTLHQSFRAAVRLALPLLLFLSSPAVLAASITVQPFQMADGRKVWGVLVRQTPLSFLLATPHEITELKRKDVMIPGSMSPEAGKIDELLSLIENAIEGDELERVKTLIPPLDTAHQAFATMIQPFMDSSMDTGNQRQDCLRQALNYYQERNKGIPQTVRALELSAQTIELERQFAHGESRPDLPLLEEFIAIRMAFGAQTNLLRKAEKAKEEAEAILGRVYKKCYEEVQAAAMLQVKSVGHPDGVIALMAALKKGGDTAPDYANNLEQLLSLYITMIQDAQRALPAKSNPLCTLRDVIDQEQKTLTAAITELRSHTEGLVRARDQMFGAKKDRLTALIADQIRANDKAVEETEERRTLLLRIRTDFRQAALAFETGQFKDALDQYRALHATIQNANLPAGEVVDRVAENLLHAEARYVLQRLRTPQALTADDMQALADEGARFHGTNKEKLPAFGIPSGTYELELERLANYRKFRLRYKDLQENLQGPAIVTWTRLAFVSRWMVSLGEAIPDAARKEWEEFVADREEPLFLGATEAFFQNRTSLEPDDWKVLNSFIRYRLDRNDPAGALEYVNRGLALLTASPDHAVRPELLAIKTEIGETYVRKNQVDQAFHVFQELETSYPEYAAANNIGDKIAVYLKQSAEAQVNAGNVDAALAIYGRIALNYTSYAERNRLYDKIVELRLRGASADDSQGQLAILNDLCARFPGVIGGVPAVRDRSKELIDGFDRLWQHGEFSTAVQEYRRFVDSYPALNKECKIVQQVIRKTAVSINKVLQDSRESLRPIPNTLIQALSSLIQEFPVYTTENKLDSLFWDVKIQRANEFKRTNQFGEAIQIYDEIIKSNPDIAQQDEKFLMLVQEQTDLHAKYWADRILSPLSIRGPLDWLAVIFTLLIWPIMALRAFWLGRTNGHLSYRLVHVATTGCVFLALLFGFLYGKYPYHQAFAFAYVLPIVVYQALGFSTYLFFPLVYCERMLSLEQTLLAMVQNRLLAKIGLINRLAASLEKDVARRQNDLPLLHDRTLYLIEQAIFVAANEPEVGYALFEKLIARLDQELVKTSTWQKHYSTCIYNLGAIAYHLDREEEARKYLLRHLEDDPKHVETHRILIDILYGKGEYEAAIPHLKVCLAIYGKDDSLWFRLGRCFFETGNYVSAYKCFVAVRQKDRNTLFYGARAFANAQELQKAVELFQTIIKQSPQDSEAIYYLASTFAHFGEDPKAVKIVALIRDGDPFYTRAQAIIGNILFRSDKLKDAGEAFAKILKQDPKCIPALIGLGQLAIVADKRDHAMSLFQQALKIDGKNPYANYFVGMLSEDKNADQAVPLYEVAATCKELRRISTRRSAKIRFFKNEYDKAAGDLAVAFKEGETSVWYLYLYAYSLVMTGQVAPCGEILERILGSGDADDGWVKTSTQALYSIGVRLFEHKSYRTAYQCLERVQERVGATDSAAGIRAFIEEAKFRTVVQMIGQGKYTEAQQIIHNLAESTQDPSRLVRCNYYNALAYLFLKKFAESRSILAKLTQKEPNNPRYIYHLIVAEAGCGNDQGAATHLIKLRDMSLPPHIAIGMQTVRAYMDAGQGKLRQAELKLTSAAVPALATEFPGAAYLRQRVLLTRIFYLCHARDSRKINTVIPELSAEYREEAVLLHARAAIECKELKVARDLVREYMESSSAAQRLFMILSSELTVEAVAKARYREAREIIAEVPSPPEALAVVSSLLIMAEEMEHIDTIPEVSQTIHNLNEYLQKVQDPKLLHSIIHNLAILNLKLAIMVEDTMNKTDAGRYWKECMDFWDEYVFSSTEYWSLEQERFGASAEPLKAFSSREVEVIFRKMISDDFAPMFCSYILSYFRQTNEAGIQRHLDLLYRIGDKSGNAKGTFSDLRKMYTDYMKDLAVTDEQLHAWDFTICSLLVQSRISEVLELEDAQELKARLTVFRDCKVRYPTPEEHRVAQKKYNTFLFDALHSGISGDLVAANAKLTLTLTDTPPGIIADSMLERLKRLHQGCKLSAEGKDPGIDLKEEFENLYALVKRKKVVSDTKILQTH